MTTPERRAHPRFQLTPPLRGRAFIDAIGQFDARLLDVSVDGARLLLQMDVAEDLARFLAAQEKGIFAAFPRPGGPPWKFVLLHTRTTTLAATTGSNTEFMIAGRFIEVPSFTITDLEHLVAEDLAVRT